MLHKCMFILYVYIICFDQKYVTTFSPKNEYKTQNFASAASTFSETELTNMYNVYSKFETKSMHLGE